MAKRSQTRTTVRRSASELPPVFEPRLSSYAYEKIGEALSLLVTADARVSGRLNLASQHLLRVPREGLPPNVLKLFDLLMNRLTQKQPPAGLSRVGYNLRGMRGKTGSRLAASLERIELEMRNFLDGR